MIPKGYTGIRPFTMAGIIIGLYTGSGIVGQFALLSPWIAVPVNILFTAAILLLTGEPMEMKPFISFLLCFVFCQATPVPWQDFPTRFAAVVFGSFLVAAVTVWSWRRQGHGKEGRTLVQQLRLCLKNRGYMLRMSVGIGIAMLTGMLLHLKKPLWISIVVMSLTQPEFRETFQRIRHRSAATVIGVIVFVVLFRILVPERYAFLLVLLLGYLSFFTPEYKHKQIVNAVSAINASLVLLDTTTAIENRFLCLFGGIVVVLFLWSVENLARKFRSSLSVSQGTEDGGSGLPVSP